MARDHRKLRVFNDAHQLTLEIYRQTKDFPREEWFGVRLQLRRAAASIACNIVEGCARRSIREYLNYLNIARGSAGEVTYLVDLVHALGFLSQESAEVLGTLSARVVKQVERLYQRVEAIQVADEQAQSPQPRAQSPITQARAQRRERST